MSQHQNDPPLDWSEYLPLVILDDYDPKEKVEKGSLKDLLINGRHYKHSVIFTEQPMPFIPWSFEPDDYDNPMLVRYPKATLQIDWKM